MLKPSLYGFWNESKIDRRYSPSSWYKVCLFSAQIRRSPRTATQWFTLDPLQARPGPVPNLERSCVFLIGLSGLALASAPK